MASPQKEIRSNESLIDASVATVDMKLEVVVIPVSDVERADSSTAGSGGGRTSRHQVPAYSNSPRTVPRVRSNSVGTSPQPYPVQSRGHT